MDDSPFIDWARSSRHPCLHQHADRLLELGASWDSFSQRGRDDDKIVEDLVRGGIPILAARDIVALASDAKRQSVAPLSVFWDLENMPLPAASRGRDVVARLKSILDAHGSLVQFRAYASIGLGHVQERKRSELQLSGCHLVDCPHLGRKEVADKMIIVDAMKFAFENPDGATLCFVTGDVDYAYLLAVLRERPMIRTIVISKGTLQSMLHVNCDIKMRWETDILQLARPHPSIPPPQPSPSTPVRKNVATSPLKEVSPGGDGQDRETDSDSNSDGEADDLPIDDDGEQLGEVPIKDITTTPMLPALGEMAESDAVFSPSRGHGHVYTDDDSVSSVEALTVDECWTDDAELLRRTLRTVALASPPGFGLPNGSATRAEVDKALRYSNPARFPNRSEVRDFMEQAIDARVVVETTHSSGQRLLSLPPDDDDDATFRPSISLWDQQLPYELIDSMTKRAVEMSCAFPFILFFPWKNRLTIETPFPKHKAFLQSSRRFMILMYRTLLDAQRTVAEHPWLRTGILADWRQVEPLRKERVRCTGSCDRVRSKADMLIDPKIESLYCRHCFVASMPPHASASVTTHAARRVVQLLKMMAENDDLYVRRDTIRDLLKQRWPAACGSAKSTNIWISEAVDAGAVFFFKIPGDGVSCLCLLDLANDALLAPSPPEHLETSEEEEYVVEVLRENGGVMTRTDVIEALKTKFKSMQKHAMRSKLFDNAKQKGRFFIARGPFLQAVGLEMADAKAALKSFTNARRASVEPLFEELEEDNEKSCDSLETSETIEKSCASLEIAKEGDPTSDVKSESQSRSSAGLQTDLSVASDWEEQSLASRFKDDESNSAPDNGAVDCEDGNTTGEQLKSASQVPGANTADESYLTSYNDSYNDIWDTPTWNEGGPEADKTNSASKTRST